MQVAIDAKICDKPEVAEMGEDQFDFLCFRQEKGALGVWKRERERGRFSELVFVWNLNQGNFFQNAIKFRAFVFGKVWKACVCSGPCNLSSTLNFSNKLRGDERWNSTNTDAWSWLESCSMKLSFKGSWHTASIIWICLPGSLNWHLAKIFFLISFQWLVLLKSSWTSKLDLIPIFHSGSSF